MIERTQVMRAYERFLEYIKINTRSDEESGTHPSFSGEFDLAEKLKAELEGMGLKTRLSDKCYLMGWLEATCGYEDRPCVGYIAHMDSSPSFSGKDIRPVLYENYDGGDVTLQNGRVMKVSDFPHLTKMKGETLITSDGNTLLAADDKAGIAEIITALEMLIQKGLPHGPIAVAFTPDEEIGQGADYFDVEAFGAVYAYTVDGGDVCEIEYENFNAADAKIEFSGVSVHPGSAKDVMVNALNVAYDFHGMLPEGERPEHTEGYEGFYHLTKMSGSCERAELSYIVRDHDRKKFEEKKDFLQTCTDRINELYGEGVAKLTVTDSYYNMLEKIKPCMHLIETAKKAIRASNLEAVEVPIRGGTDGARLSYMGLPCPNLGTGGFNFHGPFECITVERMDTAAQIVLDIMCSFV